MAESSSGKVRQDPDWVGMAARARCQYNVPGMDAVEVQSGLEYVSRDGCRQRFDRFNASPQERGAVLLVHGGPIPDNLLTPPTDWLLFQSLARLLAASGVTAVTFNHRFFAPELADTAMNDLEGLLERIANDGATNIGLWVFSGGGSLLGRLLRVPPDRLRCVVAYYAVLDALTPQYSAAQALKDNITRIPPLLVARAGLDMPGINSTIDRFIAAALEKNAVLDVMNHSTGQHGFDFRDDNARTREILAHTVDFIRTHLYTQTNP